MSNISNISTDIRRDLRIALRVVEVKTAGLVEGCELADKIERHVEAASAARPDFWSAEIDIVAGLLGAYFGPISFALMGTTKRSRKKWALEIAALLRRVRRGEDIWREAKIALHYMMREAFYTIAFSDMSTAVAGGPVGLGERAEALAYSIGELARTLRAGEDRNDPTHFVTLERLLAETVDFSETWGNAHTLPTRVISTNAPGGRSVSVFAVGEVRERVGHSEGIQLTRSAWCGALSERLMIISTGGMLEADSTGDLDAAFGEVRSGVAQRRCVRILVGDLDGRPPRLRAAIDYAYRAGFVLHIIRHEGAFALELIPFPRPLDPRPVASIQPVDGMLFCNREIAERAA